MRARTFCTIFTLFSSAAIAQQPAAQTPPPPAKLFAGAGDVTAMIAKARSERKPDQANFSQPIVQNAENLSGSAIDGGTRRKVGKGDWVMVPEKTPHWFTELDGTLVLMSIHLPSR